MKGFLKNIVLQSFIILLVCGLLGLLTYSIKGDFYAYYEQDEIVNRADNFNLQPKEINTVFIGSSRIFRHIDPILFDSLVAGSNSYNLGYAALFPFRSYDYLEYLTLESNEKIEHVFIELSPIALLGKNYNTNPFIYSINFDQYRQVLDYSLESKYDLPIKIKYFGGYSLLLLYKYSGIGSSKYLNHLLWGPSIHETSNITHDIHYHKGYISLDEDFKMQGDNFEDLKNRKEGFEKNYKEELKLYTDAYKRFTQASILLEKDTFTEYILDKIKVLTDQGKKVHFIISPRQEYGDLYYLKEQKMILSDFHTFDFSDPERYPLLYNKSNSFDRVHLNENGAKLFTTELARQFNEKIIF